MTCASIASILRHSPKKDRPKNWPPNHKLSLFEPFEFLKVQSTYLLVFNALWIYQRPKKMSEYWQYACRNCVHWCRRSHAKVGRLTKLIFYLLKEERQRVKLYPTEAQALCIIRQEHHASLLRSAIWLEGGRFQSARFSWKQNYFLPKADHLYN